MPPSLVAGQAAWSTMGRKLWKVKDFRQSCQTSKVWGGVPEGPAESADEGVKLVNLYGLLRKRAEAGSPVRVGVIGAGKFASMFFSQVPTTPWMQIVAVVELDVERAKASLARTGWAPQSYAAASVDDAVENGTTFLTSDAEELFGCNEIEIVLEVTGNPIAGTHHALRAIAAGKHIVMVNVEADAFARPPDEVDRDDRGAAHGVDVRQRIRGGDAPEVVRVVDDRGEEIRGRQDGLAADTDRCGVITVVEPDEDARVRLTDETLDRILQLAGRDLAPAPATGGELRQSNRLHGPTLRTALTGM